MSTDYPVHPTRASIYGFHATLVAPFPSLVRLETLIEVLNSVALRTKTIEVGPLELSLLEPGFPALIPKNQSSAINDLESTLVRVFSQFRPPLTKEELARREPLTARQRTLAKKWGYPYVLDQFRYHLTLGDNLADPDEEPSRNKQNFLDYLNSLFNEKMLSEFVLDSLCLCRQGSVDSPFKVIYEVSLKMNPEINSQTNRPNENGDFSDTFKMAGPMSDPLAQPQVYDSRNNPLRDGLSGLNFEEFK
jgi:hypothetical protein